MTQQIAVRIPDEMAHEIDALVTAGRYATRAEAVRAGLEARMLAVCEALRVAVAC